MRRNVSITKLCCIVVHWRRVITVVHSVHCNGSEPVQLIMQEEQEERERLKRWQELLVFVQGSLDRVKVGPTLVLVLHNL